jgi:hypothetical protein
VHEPRPEQPPPKTVVVAPAYVGVIPRGMVGQWAIATRSGFLGNEWNNLITVQGGALGQIVGRIDYFVAGSSPPSRMCASLLKLVSVVNDVVAIEEMMESNKGLACPGNKKVEIRLNGGRLWVTWAKVKKDSEKITMQGWANRIAR